MKQQNTGTLLKIALNRSQYEFSFNLLILSERNLKVLHASLYQQRGNLTYVIVA